MTGYDWRNGKSNNAVQAEAEGKMNATKFAVWAKHASRRFRGCTAADIRHALSVAEWHHASKLFNRVSYYDPIDLLDLDARKQLEKTIHTRKANQRLLREHGKRGMNYVLTHEGEAWFSVSSADVSDPDLTSRLESSLDADKCKATMANLEEIADDWEVACFGISHDELR